MNFSTLFVSLATPLARRVLTALGIGLISYGAVQAAFNAAQSQLLILYGSAGSTVTWMLESAGFNVAMGIVLGAIAAKVGLNALSRFGKLST